jgi:RNA polymerase sigma-70 factor (sigma-E family)
VRAADDAEFSAFVAASAKRLLRLAYLLTGDRDAADDLLQGALERAYRRWPRLLRDGAPEAYVRRALINGATDRWRRRSRAAETPLADLDWSAADPGDDIVAHDAVIRAVRGLPAGQRAVLVLRYFEDLTEAQTASVLGCSIGTVKSQHARALSRLRALMPAGRP